MSRSSFGKPPQPQLGMSGPKAVMQPPPVRPPPQTMGIQSPAPMQAPAQPSMFRRPVY